MSKYVEDAVKVLRLLAFSARPVLLEEAAEAVAVELGDKPRFDDAQWPIDPYAILTVCSSLITILVSTIDKWRAAQTYGRDHFTGVKSYDRMEDVTVKELKLAHFSVKEWLVSSRTAKKVTFLSGFTLKAANDTIAQTCLDYILHVTSSTNMAKLGVQDVPFIKYAMEYWPYHLRLCDNEGYSTLCRDCAWSSFSLIQFSPRTCRPSLIDKRAKPFFGRSRTLVPCCTGHAIMASISYHSYC